MPLRTLHKERITPALHPSYEGGPPAKDGPQVFRTKLYETLTNGGIALSSKPGWVTDYLGLVLDTHDGKTIMRILFIPQDKKGKRERLLTKTSDPLKEALRLVREQNIVTIVKEFISLDGGEGDYYHVQPHDLLAAYDTK